MNAAINISPRKYSDKQEAIFDFGCHGQGSCIVIAVAGSGKTTTMIELFNRVTGKTVLMLAFNKNIAEELKKRMPKHVISSTFHSVGYQAWNKYVGGRVQVDSNKVSAIMKELLSDRDNALYGAFVKKMVGYAKGSGMGFLMENVEQNWLALAAHFDCTPDSEAAKIELGIDLARRVLAQSIAEAREIIDYDDMLFMPLIENVAFQKFDIVGIDEAQDTNGVQRALLKRMLFAPHGRLIAVGDPKQAIYGFRGADSSATEMIKKEFGCIELPLTVSYRCPQAVVAKAQEIVPYILASDKAPIGIVANNPGTVEVIDGREKFVAQPFRANDAILCRNTAPLISLAYCLIGKRIGCQILGRDIGKGLIDLVKKMKAANIEELQAKLTDYERREVDKLIAKGQDDKAEAVRDRVNCVNICANALPEGERSVEALITSISNLFSDGTGEVVTLCTVHKSKGLEWERVYILDADKYMPSKWARQAWQKEQEMNLMYVAYTRAKLELYFIESDHVQQNLAASDGTAPVPTTVVPKIVEVTRAPGEVLKGDRVKVTKGKNAPIGFEGVVTQAYGEPWFAIYVKGENGEGFKTYAKNVEVLK